METWSVSTLSSYIHQIETCVPRKQQQQNQMARVAVLLVVSSLCCPLHAQGTGDFITSETNVTTPETRILISAPYAIVSKSLYVFTTGIPIQPVYIQAPSGLYVWLTIQCRGGAARLTVPNYVANHSLVQTDPTGEWIQPPLPLNESWSVTGLGIKFNQNVSVANDALATLRYGKGRDNDIAGKATMTITLNWNVTVANSHELRVFTKSERIFIWAPTALTSLSTFQATVATVCLVGIFGLCCMACVNSVGVSYLRRYNVMMARETRDQLECEQNRIFNPMWMPCAPTQSGYYNIESTPNPLILVQRRMEIKCQILRIPNTFNLMDRLTRVRHLKSSSYGWFGCRLPWAAAPPPPRDSSSDDELPPGIRKGAPRVRQLQSSPIRGGAMTRQQPRVSFTRNSTQLPPILSQQRASLYNWEQAQAQAQAAMYPQPSATYPGNLYGSSQDPEAQGNRRSYETITVGFAFMHHRLARNVPTNAKHSSAATFSSKENLRSGDRYLCGAQESRSTLPDHSKGKEPLRLQYSLEQFKPRHRDMVLHTILPTISLNPANNQDEGIVTDSLECGPVTFEAVIPCEGLPLSQGLRVSEVMSLAERGSDASDGASEPYGSPLSDLYEDVLESCSPTNCVSG